MSTATYIQSETEFDSLIASEGLVVVDFTAQWCGPCKLVAPLMDRLANDYSGRLQVFKLDLDANKFAAKRLGIRSIPAVMLFRKGEVLETLVGLKKYEEFTEAVDQCLTRSVQETSLDQAETIDSSLSEPGFTQNSDHSLSPEVLPWILPMLKADHEYHPNRPLPQLRQSGPTPFL